ncbi:hypothetical protein [Streptomyces tagetis]|uniref:Uncharacterized protein n=1 Tax=Streptomyces tagetis TaxID=2820809 RepID=A0A940XLA7_9ACTN|nr:hypothetical protein [Streptomyces sp. RG38]MBQ0826649.1 hypothetical protein [Streptomyces sp. RG38]
MRDDRSVTLPAADPFTSLAAHFGMLLGVADLEAVVGHPWAKMRLHNAWLHGGGVVWGFGIGVDGPGRELRISPGLALDDLGRELYLPVLNCLDLAQWYAEHDKEVESREIPGGVAFDAHVVARFRACLARPVPALASSCDGADAETAYSRLRETTELLLVPGRSGRTSRYPRLRRLFGLPGTGDAEIDTAIGQEVDPLRAQVTAASDAGRSRAWLDAVRRCAALDTVDHRPGGLDDGDGSVLLPGTGDAGVVLGDLLDLRIVTEAGTTTAGVGTVDVATRTSHVDTATLLELASAGAMVHGGA